MFRQIRHLRLLSLCLVALAGARGIAAPERIQGATVVQGEEVERFLATAKIVRIQRNPHHGVTGSRVVTLELDGVTRFANFKTIDHENNGITTFSNGTSEGHFQDSWRTEVAAYELDKLIGLGMVPATVKRTIGPDRGSLQIWAASMMPEAVRYAKQIEPPDVEAWNRWLFNVRLFDNLIYNVDRNIEHLLITNDWRAILLDHSRAFRTQTALKEPEALTRFSTSLLDGIAKLDEKTMRERMGEYLTIWQIKAVLQRRDRILALARERAAANGEANVLYP